jgi:predicted nucleotidyltransferase
MKPNTNLEHNLRRLKNVLSQKFGVMRIGYFDCYIDLHHNHDCEVNILVELEKPLGWDFFTLKEFLEKKLQTRIDICTPNALKPALREEIMNQTRFV